MAYITTEWDYDIKQEVFKVSGSKGYAHTTDTILKRVTLPDGSFKPPVTTNLTYGVVEFTLEVLRDIGNSQIVFYDNNTIIPFAYKTTENGSYSEEISVLEWSDQNSSIWVQLQLNYGVEHNIHARYMGNTHGLPSKSLDIPIDLPIPSGYVPSLDCSYDGTSFDTDCIILNNDSSWDITITFDGEQEVSNKTIKVYKQDGTLLTTLTTDSSGDCLISAYQITFSDGVHPLKLMFEGDEHYTACEKDIILYLGMKVTMDSVASKYVNGQTAMFNVTTSDYKNNPITNLPLELKGSLDGTSYITVDEDTTGVDGKASLTAPPNQRFGYTQHYFQLYSNSTLLVEKSINVVNSITMSLSLQGLFDENAHISGVGRTVTATATVHGTGDLSGYYIVFEGGVTQNVLTDSRGKASVSYECTGAGLVQIYANCGYYNSHKTYKGFDDVLFYMNPTGSLNEKYIKISGIFKKLANHYQLQQNSIGGMALVGFGSGETITDDWAIQFEVPSATQSMDMVLGTWNMVNETPQATFSQGTLAQSVPAPIGGDTVLITKQDNYLDYSVNGVSKYNAYHNEQSYPMIGVKKTNQSDGFLNLKEIKMWRL